MRHFIITICVFCLAVKTGYSQTVKFDWAAHYAGSSFDGGQAITLDAAGNIYATGYYSKKVDFDPGPGVYNLTSSSTEDLFITKSSPDGKLLWAKTIGDFRYQAGYALTIDYAGNLLVTGIFFGTVDFDPGPGEKKLVSAGNEDVFILKLGPNGDFLWAKKIGGSTNDYSNAILTDNTGNIYLNGYFDGTSNFNTDNGTYNLTSHGASDIYVCKLNSSGSLVWAKNMGGTGSEGAYGMGLDNQNNVYAAGFFFGNSDFDPGAGTFNLQSTGFGDGFIVKLSSSGTLVNANRFGGDAQVRITNLQVDAAAGFLYICGYFDGSADFDGGTGTTTLTATIGEEDAFMAKYNLNTELQWAKQFSGPSFQRIYDMETDNLGNVYATGYFDQSCDFDPGTGTHLLQASGKPDAFVCRLNAAGDFVWVAAASGPDFEAGYSVKLNTAGDVIVFGNFNASTDFDPGAVDYTLTSEGESEVFMWKLKQCYNPAITRQVFTNACGTFTLNGQQYDSSGIYTQYVLNQLGCDSIITELHLTINRIMNTVNAAVCQGKGWLVGGKMQTKAGTYFDTLRTAAGCDSVVITNLTINQNPKPVLGPDRSLCAGQALVLDPGNFASYQWQDGSTAAVYPVAAPGLYSVIVTDANNCSTKETIRIIDIVQPPSGFLQADTVLCTGNTLQLYVPGFKSWLWNDGSTAPSKLITSAGIYRVTVTDRNNCIATASINISASDCITAGIPNAFTPNNDGLNDIFRPVVNKEILQYNLKVFNRNGKMLFQSASPLAGWNGSWKSQPQPAGSYVYSFVFTDITGKTHLYKGSILLVR